MALDFAPADQRSAALGLFGVSTLSTHALAPTLGELLVHHSGFGILFPVAAAFSVAALVVAWPLVDGGPHRAAGPAHAFRPGAILYSVLITVTCSGVAFGAVVTYVPTFVRDAGLGVGATFFLSYTAAAVLTRVVGSRLGDSLGRGP